MDIKRAIVVPLAASVLLAGCGNAGKTTSGTASGSTGQDSASSSVATEESSYLVDNNPGLLIVSGAPEDQDLIMEIGANFKKQYPDCPYTVSATAIGESTIKDNVLSDVQNAPDVFTFADDQLSALVAGGILTPVENDDISSRNIEASVDAASVNDKLYAYPLTADNGYFLYYNKSALSEDDVKTLDGILKKAADSKKKFTMDFTSGWYLYAFYGNTDMTVGLNDDGLTNYCTWNATDTAITGLDVAESLEKIAANKGFQAGGDDILTAGANDGSVIAGVSGVWEEQALKDAWGDNLGATKLPTYTAAGKQVQMASYAGYKLVGVNSFSPKKQWADKFADFFTNEENQTLRFTERGQGPANKNAAASGDVGESIAIQAVIAQSEFASLQRISGKFWDPVSEYGNEIIAGKKITQKRLDTLVKGITAGVSE